MALVAYASSDEDLEEIEETADRPVVEHSLFADLPVPKSPSGISDEPELIIEPSEKELSLREMPPPPPPLPSAPVLPAKKTKKLIQLPSFPTDDSDDEEDKRPKVINRTPKDSFNLFGDLPKPKHSSTKEVGRTLVPHVLTKQNEPPKRQMAAQTVKSKAAPEAATANVRAVDSSKKTLSHGLLATDYGSEDEDDKDSSEVTSFFSLDSASVGKHLAESGRVNVSLAPDVESHSEFMERSSEKARSLAPEGFFDSDLNPGGKSQSLHPTASGWETTVTSVPVQASTHASYGAEDWEPNNESGNGYDYTEYPQSSGIDETAETATQTQVPPFGRKRKRGREEEIKVIEVNLADHLKSSNVEFMKNLTVEQDIRSHSKKKNKDMPTSQQKRKHQINYLAHQAKERELELKNQWAENKFSKKQTQSKYGF